MNIRSREIELPYYAKLVCVLLSLVIIVYGLHVLEGLLIPLVFSILFAVLLFPLVNVLKNGELPRMIAIVLCLLLALGVLTALFWGISIQISNFAEVVPQFITRAKEYISSVSTFADERLNIDRQRQLAEFTKYLNQALSEGGTILTTTLLTTTNILANLFLVLLFSFFLLLYRDFFRSFLYKVFSEVRRSID